MQPLTGHPKPGCAGGDALENKSMGQGIVDLALGHIIARRQTLGVPQGLPVLLKAF